MSHPTWVRGLKRNEAAKVLLYCVAPYVGAWIETRHIRPQHRQHDVAPYVGAWIETKNVDNSYETRDVAPYVGAWIET